MKKPLPIWSVVVAVLVSLGAVAGLISSINPTADKDAVLRARAKPGGATTPSGSTYGMPKGTPIAHDLPSPAAGSRQKPSQG